MSKIWAQNISVQPLDTSISVDRMVLIQMNAMNEFYKTNFKIFKTNGLTRATKRNFDIEVNTSDILKQSQAMDTIQLRSIVTLVVAHEFYHLIQYCFYDRPFKSYEPRVFESQADLLAGIYLFSRTMDWYYELNDESLINFGGVVTVAPIYRNAYSFFFNIGTNTFAMEDHPTKEQRATSISRGVLYGYHINLMYSFYNYDSKKRSKDTVITINSLREGLKELNIFDDGSLIKPVSTYIDSILSFSQLMNWSYEQAKLIVHGNVENLADVVRTNLKLKGDHSKVISKSTYKNIGNDTLLFTFENRMSRDSSDTSAKFINRIDSNRFAFESRFLFETNAYHTIKLYPQSSVTISDTFPIQTFWQINVLPPSIYSLFYCNSSREKSDETNQMNLNLNQKFPQNTTLPDYLIMLEDAILRKKCSKIIATMPHYVYGLISSRNIVEYDGIVPLNSPFSCTVSRNLNTDKIDVTLRAEFTKPSNADSFYIECVRDLDPYFNQSNTTQTFEKSEARKFKLYTASDCFISIFCSSIRSNPIRNHKYTVSINVWKNSK